MRIQHLAWALALTLLAGPAFAHHSPVELGTVRITEAVTVGGTVLQPGTYTIRDTGEHGAPLPGQSEYALAKIEFLSNNQVMASDFADVMAITGRTTVGTSGSTPRPMVQKLKGNEFLRITINSGDERYLIHLPLQAK